MPDDDAREAMETWVREDCPHTRYGGVRGGALERRALFWPVRPCCLVDLFATLETTRQERDKARRDWQGMVDAYDQCVEGYVCDRHGGHAPLCVSVRMHELEAENARQREALRQVRDDASALAAASDTGDAPDIVRGLRSLYTLADAALAGTEDNDGE